MGLNTTVIVLNDRLGDISKDTRLGELLALSIGSMHKTEDGELSPVGSGVYIVETHHADDTAVVLVGGNTSRVLTYLPATNPTDRKEVIEKLGEVLKLRKKPTLEEVKELAKGYGWRCITLRRKTKPMKVTRKKIS
jgi:hypothetical protein